MGYWVVTGGQKYAPVGDVGIGVMSRMPGLGGRYGTPHLLYDVEKPATVAGSYSKIRTTAFNEESGTSGGIPGSKCLLPRRVSTP